MTQYCFSTECTKVFIYLFLFAQQGGFGLFPYLFQKCPYTIQSDGLFIIGRYKVSFVCYLVWTNINSQHQTTS